MVVSKDCHDEISLRIACAAEDDCRMIVVRRKMDTHFMLSILLAILEEVSS